MSDLNEKPRELPQIDFQAEAATAISNIETASIAYESNAGKVNQPLVDARNSVVLLTAQLAEARNHLAAIEAKGSWLDKFNNAVLDAERMVAVLVGQFERGVVSQLLGPRFGQV